MEHGGGDNPFFITRNVENDLYAQSDDEYDDEANDTTKSGKYIKFYCADENRWIDEL